VTTTFRTANPQPATRKPASTCRTATIDFKHPFNKEKVSFGGLKKLDQGGAINVKYNGNSKRV
jgi:hypothetical protein